MPYREVDSATKCEVVKEYWRKRKIAPIARFYGVSRHSVYDWVRMAEVGIRDALRSEKDASKQVNLLNKLKEENSTLKSKLHNMYNINRIISQNLQLRVTLKKLEEHEIRPGQCLKCKSWEIRKNGKYEVKDKERKDIIRGTNLVQRFTCKRCGTRIYLSKKGAL